mgnify:CR=1 FL=1
MLDGTTLDIVVDKFNPWSDDFPKTNRKLKDILQEENLSLDLNFAKNYDAVTLYFGSDQAKPKNGDVKKLNELAEILKRLKFSSGRNNQVFLSESL